MEDVLAIEHNYSSIIFQKSQPSLPMNKVGSHHVENFCYYDILKLF